MGIPGFLPISVLVVILKSLNPGASQKLCRCSTIVTRLFCFTYLLKIAGKSDKWQVEIEESHHLLNHRTSASLSFGRGWWTRVPDVKTHSFINVLTSFSRLAIRDLDAYEGSTRCGFTVIKDK